MLATLAREANNKELAKRSSDNESLARIHTIAHLAGGQPLRLWALLGSALTAEDLHDLRHYLNRFDDLTPYYQGAVNDCHLCSASSLQNSPRPTVPPS